MDVAHAEVSRLRLRLAQRDDEAQQAAEVVSDLERGFVELEARYGDAVRTREELAARCDDLSAWTCGGGVGWVPRA